MYLITISLLLFSNLFISITNAEKPLSRRVHTRKFYDENEECVCFPGGQSLNPELHGMERLVVYLYRTTNQIILHKPSLEKQKLIPNIPFTEGDLLKVVTADTFASIFNNVPYNAPSQDHTDPIGLNFGTIQSVNTEPNFKEYSPFYSNTNDHVHSNIQFSIEKYLDQSRQPSLPWYLNKQKLIYPEQSQPQPQPNNVEFNNPFQTNSVDTNYPNIPFATNTANIWESKVIKHSTPVSLYQTNSQLLESDEIIKLLKYNGGEPAPNWSEPNLTFDNWLNKQIKLIQYPQVSQDIRLINKEGLRKLVQKILFENHIEIGATGMMIDENGTLINLEYLDLRPILIGDPVKFHTLQENQRFTLSQSKPFFLGLLITFNNPPRILGIVPLGETHISSHEQIIEAPNSPSIQHYKTTLIDQPDYFYNNVEIPLDADSFNDIWNPVISNGWRRRSQYGPKAKKLEVIPKAEESSKALKSKTLGHFNSNVSWGQSKATKVPKPQKEVKKSNNSKRSSESNPDLQFISAHRGLDYNNIYDVPFSSSIEELHENAENSVFSKPNDSGSLQLILSSINIGTGAHGGNSKHYSHLIVTPFDDNSEMYVNPSIIINSPYSTMTEHSGKSDSHFILTIEGNPENHLNSSAATSHHHLIVKELTSKPDYYSTLIPLNGKLGENSNVFERHSFSPKLIVSRLDSLDNNFNFNSNPDSNTHNVHITHINSPHLTVRPYNTKTNNKWNSDLNSAWTFYPDNNEPVSINWQQKANSPQIPSKYYKFREFTSPVPYSYVTKPGYQVTTPPNAEKLSWTDRQKADGGTTQQAVAAMAPVAVPLDTISNHFGDTQDENEVVTSSGDLNDVNSSRRSSRPSLHGVLKTFLKMVLHDILIGGSETAVKSNDEINVSDFDIYVNSTNNNDKTGVVEDFDRPDYRIIGGSAATGSGAPLSNKGRSGRL